MTSQKRPFFLVWIDYNDSISDKTTTNNITHLVDDLHLFYYQDKILFICTPS